MREKVATALQLAGMTAGVAAGFTVSATVGLVVAAVELTVFGVAMERG